MWRFHCRAATALPIWIPSGAGRSNFGTEDCIFCLHLSGKSMFCRHAMFNNVITDFPIASRKLNDKTPLITVHESRVQRRGHKQTLICWFWSIFECTQWHEKSSADDGEEYDESRWTKAQDSSLIVSTQVGICFLIESASKLLFPEIVHNMISLFI